jgi:hypothetical protein
VAGTSTVGAGGAPKVAPAISAWRGEDIAGHTILLHAEQGLGHASHEQYAQGLGVHALDRHFSKPASPRRLR